MKQYANPAADAWYREITADFKKFPFSFDYDGICHYGFDMPKKAQHTKRIGDKETVTAVFSLDETIEITLLCTHYYDFGVTEWTVWFENLSDKNSGVISECKSELRFRGQRPMLKGILGDHVNAYRPYAIDIADQTTTFVSHTGRPTHIVFPYFNLEFGEMGAMLAIGWSGTWKADFHFEGEETVYTAQSVNGLYTYLKPKEKIRTALFVCGRYGERRESYGTNYWRRWFIAYNLPKADQKGTALAPFSTCCLASDTGLPNSDGSISENYATWRPSLEKMLAEDVKVDFRWVDAGWYIAPDKTSAQPYASGHDWWDTVGTWELDSEKWPGDSFLESTEFARAHGMKTLLWFEPERVSDPENLEKYFGYRAEWAIARENNPAIANNIGIPECLDWTLGQIKKVLSDNRVEMYREDNNSNPAELWSYLDAKEGDHRRGITECKFIDGHYRMWDEIIACTLSYGGCGFVDSCASGGGRNDLESLRRGVPLLRSDADRTTVALRLSMTTALGAWIPFMGANTKEKESQLAPVGNSDPYIWRASYLPALNVDSQFVQDESQNFDMLRFGLSEWKRVSSYLLKDFYVHTPWHSEHDRMGFTAYSYFDEDTQKGVLFVFRGEHCLDDTLHIKLPYVGEKQSLVLTDEDTKEEICIEGSQNQKKGIRLTMAHPRQARLLWICVQ